MGAMGTFTSLVLVLGVLVLCSAQTDDYCQTPRNQQGECKVITSCQALLSLLANKPIRTQDADLLKRSQCGFEGTLPKVCCPLGGSSQAPTTEKTSSIDSVNVENTNLLPSNEICGGDNQDRIYGGKEAGLNEYPWMALIEYERENGKRGFYCGGVLISKRYILTAAHCLKGKDLPRTWKLVSVRLGEHNLDNETDCADLGFKVVCIPSPVNVPVEERIAHEDYDPNDPNQYHDIAILRLARDVQYTETVKPVCLPKTAFERQTDLVGKKLVVAGWGKTENRSESPVKLKLEVPVKANDICVRTYNRANVNLSKSQLCAGGEKGKDSCRGDSGGPLMHLSADENGEIVWYTVGVVSFGPSPCGMQGWPGVYTKVADYVPWIVSKMRP